MAHLETAEIEIGYPKTEQDITLAIRLGACKAQIQAGQPRHWAEGTYEHPTNALPPTLEQDGGKITLSQDYKKWAGFFTFVKAPELSMSLSPAKPFALQVEGGALDANYHLGGLPLTKLVAQLGAGDFDFTFDDPNPEVMETLEVTLGAASLEMINLANANFRKLKLKGSAGEFKLDFGGKLTQDAEVEISTNLAETNIIIPPTLAATFTADVSLSDVVYDNGFVQREGRYLSPAALAGNTPLVTFTIKGSVGNTNVKLGD